MSLTLQLAPIIVSDHNHTRVTFVYEFDFKGEGLWDCEESLITFIDRVHQRYYERYSSQPQVSRSLRVVDAEKLARDALAEIENSQHTGGCRLYIHFFVEAHKGESYFVKEYVNYSLHWYEDGDRDKMLTLFPLGYQIWHNVDIAPSSTISTAIFDLSVLNKEIQSSMEYYKEKALPGLNSYMKYLCDVFKDKTNGREVRLDMVIIQERLDELITTMYERRQHEPGNRERHIVFFNAIYTGDTVDRQDLTFHIVMDTYETTTPHLFRGHPDYKATIVPGKQREMIAVYGSQTALNVKRPIANNVITD